MNLVINKASIQTQLSLPPNHMCLLTVQESHNHYGYSSLKRRLAFGMVSILRGMIT